MKKVLLFIAAIVIVAGFSGCETDTELVAGVEYYPAGEGHTWEYRLINRVVTWTMATDSMVVVDTSYVTVTCKETTMNDGSPVWEYAEVGDMGTSYVYVKFGDTEIEIYESKADVEAHVMPADIKVSASWDQSESVEVGDLGTGSTVAAYSVESTEEVTVPAGTFTALKATASSTVSVEGSVNVQAEFSEWFDADAGRVKIYSKAVNEVAGVSYTSAEEIQELIEFKQ